MPQASSSQAPAIRVFQFDQDGIGAIKNSVNLFRGDVNLPLNLFSLKGRNDLDLDLSLMGQSNVRDQVDRWSLDAPTGVVGLGWTFPLERIEADVKGTGSTVFNDYFLVADESRQLLKPNDDRWLRLTLPTSLIPTLDAGGKVSPDVRRPFAAANLALSRDAEITVVEAGQSWSVSCPNLEEVFEIEAGHGMLNGYDGGRPFEAKSYQFWRIRYYPTFEKWAVTRDNGITNVYGGGVSGAAGEPKTSRGNSVLWNVRWNNWLGSTSRVDDSKGALAQSQYASGWYLSRSTTVWGDTISYDYETVDQQVGSADGLPYTKAIYLSQITDVLGRLVKFSYGDKADGSTEPKSQSCPSKDLPAGIREFMDPHRQVPSNEPNAYQDRYETRFLDAVAVESADGDELFNIKLDYCLENVSVYPADDPLYLDTFKRYLTSVSMVNVDGESLPGLEFRYNWTTDEKDARGSLSGMTYPQGGTIAYDYEQATLEQIDRQVQIDNPFPGITAGPRIFFGSDYTVVTWYRPGDQAQLQVQVWSWMAGWYNSEATTFTFDNEVNVDSINVIPQKDFFALSFFDASKEKNRLYLYHKDERAIGQWLIFEPAVNDFGTADNPPQIAAGEQFVVLTRRDLHNNFHVDRFTWERQDDTDPCSQTDPLPNAYGWTENDNIQDLCQSGVGDDSRFFITAYRNYYAILCYDTTGNGRNRLQIFYQDSQGTWFDGPVTQPRFALAPIPDSGPYAKLAPSDTFIALAVITAWQDGSPNYKTFLFQWDAFDGTDTVLKTTEDVGHLNRFLPLGPQDADDSLVGFGPDLRRYNGDFAGVDDGSEHAWLKNSFDMKLMQSDDAHHWFATGPDYGLKVDYKVLNGLNAQLAAFDPNADSGSWQTAPQSLAATNDPQGGTRSFFVTAGGEDYFTFDTGVYFRGQSTDWSDARNNHLLPTRLGAGLSSGEVVDTLTIQNQAPGFIAYPVVTNDGPIRTEVVFLRNGRFISAEPRRLKDGEVLFQSVGMNGDPRDKLNGKLPAGQGAFYTYPVKQGLDGAQHITLYRYVQDDVTGALTDFRVKSLTITSGIDSDQITGYAYTDETAGFDPSANVAKYFEVKTLAGTDGSDPSQTPFGTTTSRYLNGFPVDFHNENARPKLQAQVDESVGRYEQVYSMLDGLQQSEALYDAQGLMIQEKTTGWTVFPCAGSGENRRPLFGTWVRETDKNAVLDGVANQSVTGFDPDTGQPSSMFTSAYDSGNQERRQGQQITYGSSVYEWLRWNHVLNANLQSSTVVDDQASSSSAFPQSPWTRPNREDPSMPLTVWAQAAEYAWRGGDSPPEFDFSAWTPTSDLPSWLRQNLNLKLTDHGQVTESEDATGMVNTLVFGTTDSQPLATFHNASADNDEADYYGFETYEINPGWQLGSGLEVEQGIAHAGCRGVRLPAGTAMGGLTRELEPQNTDRPYLFSCWVRTAAGFAPTSSAGWKITVLQNGSPVGDAIEAGFEASDLGWLYLHQMIDLSTYPQGGPLTVRLQAGNTSSADVWLDDLMFSPLEGLGSAQIYDPLFRNTLGRVGPANQTQFSVYDRFQQEVAGVGADGNVKTLNIPYLSRQAADAFDPTSPNATWEIKPASDGFYQDFRRDPDFTRHWTGSGWSVADGALKGSGPLVLNGDDHRDFGVRLQVEPVGELGSFVLRLGSTRVAWNGANRSWTLNGGSAVNAEAFTPDLAFLVSGANLIFLADGRRLFGWTAGLELSGAFEITSSDPVELSDILYFESPTLGTTYSNAAGQDHQRQVFDGTSVQVQENLYDGVGKKIVETKSGSFAATSGNDLMAYRPGFVTGFDPSTGVMSGEIADQYPDDEKYPYSRTLYESAPTGRAIEKGLPGKDYAINLTVPADQRPTVKLAYSNNQDVSFPPQNLLPLKAGEFRIQTNTDANGRVSHQITNGLGDSIANGVELDGDRVALSAQQETIDDQGRLTTALQLPNFYERPALDGHENFVRSQLADPLGRLLRVSDPDTEGDLKMIYDDMGRLRFLQDSNGAQGTGLGSPYALYIKYDVIGRTLEKGWFTVDWGDGSQLEQKARTDPSYPQDGTWVRRFDYDGSGSGSPGADALGRMTAAHSANHDLAKGTVSQVDETFTYDISGNIRLSSLAAEAWDQGEVQHMAYRYDNTNSVVGVTYLADDQGKPTAGGLEIAYSYDPLGQLSGVERVDGDQRRPLGNFTFDPNGRLVGEAFNPGSDGALFASRCYNSPGWLRGINVVSGEGGQISCDDEGPNTLFAESLSYRSGGYQGAGFHNQLVASARTSFPTLKSSPPEGFFADFEQRFDYDSYYRVTTAETLQNGTPVPAWGLGTDNHPLTYDDNGNTRDFSLGGDAETWAYHNGTDRLCNTDGSPCGGTDAYQYDPNGNVIAAGPSGLSKLTYDPMSQRTTGIDCSDPVSFLYGNRHQRILKSTADTATFYVHGLQSHPMVEKVRSGSSETVRFNVYGPSGLLGVIDGSEFSAVIKDHTDSTRAVFDSRGELQAAYNYLPFGAPLGSVYEPNGRPVVYLFTGQELDSETGLYNFKARMYDPQIGRFYGPDPAKQAASPFILGFDDPLLFIDPSGMWSWAAFGMAMAGLVIAAVGVVAIVATAGAAAPVVAGAEALAISAGASATAASAIGTAVGAGVALGGSTALGAGANGLIYAATQGDQATLSGWNKAMQSGAVSGAITGAFAGLGGALTGAVEGIQAASKAAQVMKFLGRGAIELGQGAAAGASQSAASAAVLGQDPGFAAGTGAMTGLLSSFVNFGVGSLAKTPQTLKTMENMRKSGASMGSLAKPLGKVLAASAGAGAISGLANAGIESARNNDDYFQQAGKDVARGIVLSGVNFATTTLAKTSQANVQSPAQQLLAQQKSPNYGAIEMTTFAGNGNG